MKKIIIITTILITVFLSACASKNGGPINSPGNGKTSDKTSEPPEDDVFVADQIEYVEEPNVSIVIFAAQDGLFIQKSGNTEWEMLIDDYTGDIYLQDFEFAEADVDLTLLLGGEAGYYYAPRIDEVHDYEKITFNDVVDRGLIKDYEQEDGWFDGPRLYRKDDHLFCIVCTKYNEYCLYSDGEFIGAYETPEEAESEIETGENNL